MAILAVGLAGTVMIACSLGWNVSHIRSESRDAALIQARLAYDEDIVYRRWNARHGGVYVRVTDGVEPNPDMAGYPDRDVLTEGGVHLTLVNPAAMAREAFRTSAGGQPVLARLTSLNPLRQSNQPDEWEKKALLALERGADEIGAVRGVDDEEYFRYMKPLIVTGECLRCHAEHGYTEGSIRGGVSVAVPMSPLRKLERGSIMNLAAAHGLLWLVGIGGLIIGGGFLLRSEEARGRAEAGIRRYAEKLEESNRMKDLFTDIMRHDLINPAGIIGCYADFILEREVDQRTKEFGSRIRMTADRLRTMIEEASRFTELQGMDEIACEDLDLDRILRESVQDARERCGDGGPMVLYDSPGNLPLKGNPMLSSVFSNLLSNAAKYASSGEHVDVGVSEDGPSWTVSVADYGPGIPAADREKIFCRFERLQKKNVQGTGLGLAIARHLVALHGGGIWVEENPAGGAVFKVRLPKEGPAAGSAAMQESFSLAAAV
jgi:signal transduction histidine kinase